MTVAIQPRDAKVLIAHRLRELATFIEQGPEMNGEAFRDGLAARLKEIDSYIDAFCSSHLTMGAAPSPAEKPR